jgi:hypothetical protein
MRRTLISGSVVAVLAAGLVWSLRSGDPAAPVRSDDGATRRELAQLRSELSDLRVRNLGVARAAFDPAAPATAPASATSDRKTPSEPAAAEESRDAAGTRQRMPGPVELVAQLDSKFAAEDVDPAWSHSAARQADEALASTIPAGSTLGRVECHASLCRVESFHTSRDAYRSFVDTSFVSRDTKLWNAASTSIILDASDAGVKAVSFIAREGKAIPAMEPIDG